MRLTIRRLFAWKKTIEFAKAAAKANKNPNG